MNERPSNANEIPYAAAKWRELHVTNRIMSVAFYFGACVGLLGAVGAVWTPSSPSPGHSGQTGTA